MEMSNNPVKHEVLTKRYSHSILDISVQSTTKSYVDITKFYSIHSVQKKIKNKKHEQFAFNWKNKRGIKGQMLSNSMQ